MIYFSADGHWNHSRILEYAKRPFASCAEMNETLIKNWNARVQSHDTVYYLGDFCFARGSRDDQISVVRGIKRRLNGTIHFIKGNHDKAAALIHDEWASWHDHGMEVMIEGNLVTLSHFAHLVWARSHFGSYMLFAHSHGSLPDDPNALRLDVGVDCWNYAPVSWDEIKTAMSKKTFKPIDHHR